MPHRWLTGKAHELADEDFGPTDMNEVAQLTYKAFEKIEANPSLILDEEFMFDIYKPISDRVKSFAEFMQYKFEELTCFPFGSRSPLEKILPFDLLRAELFYPTCSANIQSTDMTTEIAGRWRRP